MCLASMDAYNSRPVDGYEKLNCIGEGTYGTVYRARDKSTGEIVALKKIRMAKEKGGFPLTSVREINILKSLSHPNIVDLKGVSVGKKHDRVFLVFEYCEHDLASLVDGVDSPFKESQVKTILKQLLSATMHLHKNFILHRDLKLSNVLVNSRGEMKLADFGLAREFGNPLEAYTPKVVTLWYRPPEILLGSRKYHTAADMWALGCIFGELLKHRPLLPGKTEIKQLELIFQLLGTPNERIWPGFNKLPATSADIVHFPVYLYNNLKHEFHHLSPHGIDLLSRMLTYDPSTRITAEKALAHPYFNEEPYPAPSADIFYQYNKKKEKQLKLSSKSNNKSASISLLSSSSSSASALSSSSSTNNKLKIKSKSLCISSYSSSTSSSSKTRKRRRDRSEDSGRGKGKKIRM